LISLVAVASSGFAVTVGKAAATAERYRRWAQKRRSSPA
jgi:hypothetical protein